MDRIPFSSISPKMPEKYKYCVYFLGSYADEFLILLEEKLEKSFDKFELLFFVEYVVCDVFKYSDIKDDVYWTVVDEFTMKYPFKDVVSTSKTNSIELLPDELNNICARGANRMNEYKNLYPLVNIVKNQDTEQLHFLLDDFLKNIYPNGLESPLLEMKLTTLLLLYIPDLIKAQYDFILEYGVNN